MVKKLVEVLAAVNLLVRPQGASIAELEDALEISQRTAYRLVTDLSGQAGVMFPVHEDRRDGQTRFFIKPERVDYHDRVPAPSISFNHGERLVLEYLLNQAERSPPLRPYLQSLRQKIALLGSRAGIALQLLDDPAAERPAIISSPALPPKILPVNPQIQADLLQAVSQRQVCTAAYHAMASDRVKQYRINPLQLLDYAGGIYVFVEFPDYGSISLLAVERFQQLTLLPERFEFPADFDARARLEQNRLGIVLGDEMAAVRIWFSADQAPYIRERQWGEKQVISDQADGSIILSMETTGIWDLKRLVLGYGAQAELLEPDWLRHELKTEIKAMRQRYAS